MQTKSVKTTNSGFTECYQSYPLTLSKKANGHISQKCEIIPLKQLKCVIYTHYIICTFFISFIPEMML